MSVAIVWFRQDLRISDQPALSAAVASGLPVLPVYIWDPAGEGDWAPGACTKWWLHHSLTRLAESLQQLGSPLVIRRGASAEVLRGLIQETGCTAVFWNRRYEPAVIERDTRIKAELKHLGCDVQSFNANLLVEPWEVQTQQGKPFQVFTPFWKAAQAQLSQTGLQRPPGRLTSGPAVSSLQVSDLRLLPRIPWDAEFPAHWTPGEVGSQQLLQRFLREAIPDYKQQRDFPAVAGTSRLSPHLHFGEISPRQIWQALTTAGISLEEPGPRHFLSELGWREFAHHVLYHFPHTPLHPLREAFSEFPWHAAPEQLKQWQRGETGYPIVDAGLRELWRTGWMHNRVRMIVGSFLTKDLLIPWQAGARWFWDTLLDADLANNTLGWQWVSGCGADAAPYFRVFNPISQGEKFDPDGRYVRRWCPELSRLPTQWIHQPWAAPASVLREAGVVLGQNYPEPMVDHAAAREVALAAFARIKKT
jgi:deoxyribodipyrimidine photo-lyase